MRWAVVLLLMLAPVGAVQAQPQVPTSAGQIALGFAPVVRETAPAVVNIYARRVVQGRSPFAGDPLFDGLLQGFGRRPRVQNSLGSGVILSVGGIVVSNYHVVGQATDIRVVLNDRREYDARVLLGDAEADLAILQLQGAGDLPHLPLRDSDTVEVGELVLAIGNPFGVGQTVSSGIVSGLARSTGRGEAQGYFIQTDAPINPGNSGGALVDMAGRLIGVNTSILTRSGGSNGIGFAIPSALVAAFVAQAEAGADRFARPWAGITAQAVDADMADGLGLARPGGVVLSALHGESPFAAAGLARGDVVLAVDGVEVFTPAELLYRLTVRGVGAEARVRYARSGRVAEAAVRLIAPPDSPPRATVRLGARDVLPGLVAMRANPAVAEEFGLDTTAEGIVIAEPGAVGSRVGLRTGDLVLGVNGRAVRRPADLAPALRAAVPLLRLDILRDGRRVTLRLRT